MINPNRVHRSRAVITLIQHYKSEFRLPNGHIVRGFDLPAKFKVGDVVNIQASFNITLDCYCVKPVRHVSKKQLAKEKNLRADLDRLTWADVLEFRARKVVQS